MKRDTRRVLEHLQGVGPLTSLEALRLGYGARLAARIFELRMAGYVIEDDMVQVERSDGTKARVAQYRFVSAPPAAGGAPC